MAKRYDWEILEPAEEEGGEETLHTVSLRCSMLTGKAVIAIDGTSFDIGTRPFGLRGTSQMFRLGEMAALLDFPKSGEPRILIDGAAIPQKK